MSPTTLDWPPAKKSPAFTTVVALHVFLSPSVREASPETCEPGAFRPDQKQSPSPASARQTQSKTPRQPFAWRCLFPRAPSNPQGSTPEHALTSSAASASDIPHSPPPRARRARENSRSPVPETKSKWPQRSPAGAETTAKSVPANPRHPEHRLAQQLRDGRKRRHPQHVRSPRLVRQSVQLR